LSLSFHQILAPTPDHPIQAYFALFKRQGSDAKKMQITIEGWHENALLQSFEMSPHLMSHHLIIPCVTSQIQT